MITNCQADAERLEPLRECMETYGQEGDNNAEWPWNCLSRCTVAYTCGALRRGDEPAPHNHDDAEFALCRRLASEANAIMEGVEVGMASEASYTFEPFYIVASEGAQNPRALNADTIRIAFGGTIYPGAEIVVEPLEEQGLWWEYVDAECDNEDVDTPEETAECLRSWRTLLQWFHSQPDFQNTAFVCIGEDPLGGDNGGCVFPRLAVGLTQAGSIAGIAGCVVHT